MHYCHVAQILHAAGYFLLRKLIREAARIEEADCTRQDAEGDLACAERLAVDIDNDLLRCADGDLFRTDIAEKFGISKARCMMKKMEET